MIIRLVKRKAGIALVIVLIIIASLVVIATGFAFSMGVEARLVRNTRYNPDLDWLGRSGVELARFIFISFLFWFVFNTFTVIYDSLYYLFFLSIYFCFLLCYPTINIKKASLKIQNRGLFHRRFLRIN